MRIFLTGGTGFIGSALLKELLQAGHRVSALARSDATAARLAAQGAQVIAGSLDNLDTLAKAAADSDGVIHLAHNHDFANVPREIAAAQDLAAVNIMGTVLAETGRTLIITSGTAGLTETDDGPPSYPRYPSEQAALRMASQNLRSMVVRLPPTVHGEGDLSGFVPQLIALALQKRFSAWIGEGLNTWPSVHRSDATHLFRLALEKGRPGARYHAIQDEAVPTRDIAAAIGHHLGLPTISISPGDAVTHFGFLAPILSHDIKATSHMTTASLGWLPTQLGLIDDIKNYPTIA